MAKVLAFLADGLEEVECLAVVDVLLRGGIEVELVSVTENRQVTGAHGIKLETDSTIGTVDLDEADVLFLPGGMPGTKHLSECNPLCQGLIKAEKDGKRIAAICAAPSVLGSLGLLKGKKATCYPGYEESMEGAEPLSLGVVTDGQITTARGLGYALDLGLELLGLLAGKETAERIKQAIQYDSH